MFGFSSRGEGSAVTYTNFETGETFEVDVEASLGRIAAVEDPEEFADLKWALELMTALGDRRPAKHKRKLRRTRARRRQ